MADASFVNPDSKPLWYMVPVRVLLVTFIGTLLSFAVSLFLGILGTVLVAALRHAHPNMALAYRYVAFPVAVTVALIIILSASFMEVRRHRQVAALSRMAGQLRRAS